MATRPRGWTIVPMAVFAATAARATTRRVASTEEEIFRRCNDAPNAVHVPVWAVMQSGSLAAVFAVTGILWSRDERSAATRALIAGTVVWAGVKLVKPLVGRGRPQHHLADVAVRGGVQSGLGFPSGHAAVAMTLAILVTRPGTTARRAAVATAFATGGARMYVGAHLPLDIAGGLAIGAGVGNLVLDMTNGLSHDD